MISTSTCTTAPTHRHLIDDLRAALHVSQGNDPLLPPLAELLRAFADAGSNAERIDHWIALQDWTREGAHIHTSGDDEGAQLASADSIRRTVFGVM